MGHGDGLVVDVLLVSRFKFEYNNSFFWKSCLLEMCRWRPLFLFFLLFNTVNSKQIFNINFAADDWIWTADRSTNLATTQPCKSCLERAEIYKNRLSLAH